MRCLPFAEAVYRGLQEQGLDAGQLLNNPRLYQRKGSWYRNSDSLENDLRWLICVGGPAPGSGWPGPHQPIPIDAPRPPTARRHARPSTSAGVLERVAPTLASAQDVLKRCLRCSAR
jgi:hypothetical protein